MAEEDDIELNDPRIAVGSLYRTLRLSVFPAAIDVLIEHYRLLPLMPIILFMKIDQNCYRS